MVKAIFFDVDGTLLSHTDGRVPQSTQTAFSRLRKKGIKLFAATGRHMLELEQLSLSPLLFDGYVTLNGQLCLDAKGTLLYDTPISHDDVMQMIPLFETRQFPIMIVEENKMYINCVTEAVERAQQAISTPIPEVGIYRGDRIYQFIVYTQNGETDQLLKQLTDCKMSRWNQYAVDIIPRNGGKIAGIRYILSRLGIGLNEIAAFGDGENDIDMLHCAGVGIAMGNASEIVKQQADYITDSIDQDGLANALDHFNW